MAPASQARALPMMTVALAFRTWEEPSVRLEAGRVRQPAETPRRVEPARQKAAGSAEWLAVLAFRTSGVALAGLSQGCAAKGRKTGACTHSAPLVRAAQPPEAEVRSPTAQQVN